MKKGIHPHHHRANIADDGRSTFKTCSTYWEAGRDAPWTSIRVPSGLGLGVHRLMDTGGQLAEFNRRFSGMGLKQSKEIDEFVLNIGRHGRPTPLQGDLSPAPAEALEPPKPIPHPRSRGCPFGVLARAAVG